MKTFEDCFSHDNIVDYLCRLKALRSKRIGKQHLYNRLTYSEKYRPAAKEPDLECDREIDRIIDMVMPSRKQRRGLGNDARLKCGADSVKRNMMTLKRTIRYDRKHGKRKPYIDALDAFVKEIQESVRIGKCSVHPPEITPMAKPMKKGHRPDPEAKVACRPISNFRLVDRIILSLTNKFFTELFDRYFDDRSLAFRAPREVDGKQVVTTHHHATRRIVDYLTLHKGEPLWVSECDIQKFYDSVNHEVIKKNFAEMIRRANADMPAVDTSWAERVFYSYLDCYSFNSDVLPLNGLHEYFSRWNLPTGKFGWVLEDFLSSGHYDESSIQAERIGIPQGGALSCLIANIVLDDADRKIPESPDFLYLRYCDDMIMIHTDREECRKLIAEYQRSIEGLRLVTHEFQDQKQLVEPRENPDNWCRQFSFKPFWNAKSKAPYKWDEAYRGGFPWIGFVGYEIRCTGEIRARKSSLEKEIDKQRKVIHKTLRAVSTKPRASMPTIVKSVNDQLVGMSVGRMQIWNTDTCGNEMCWKNGFRALTQNRVMSKQMRLLDKARQRCISWLHKKLDELGIDIKKKPKKKRRKRENNSFYYGKPFSYYYQVYERFRQ